MTQKQLHLLKILSREPEDDCGVSIHSFEGVTEKDVEELMKADYIRVTVGDGFAGYIKFLHLTAHGHHFIKDFCEVCECMPCDCHWGCL